MIMGWEREMGMGIEEGQVRLGGMGDGYEKED